MSPEGLSLQTPTCVRLAHAQPNGLDLTVQRNQLSFVMNKNISIGLLQSPLLLSRA